MKTNRCLNWRGMKMAKRNREHWKRCYFRWSSCFLVRKKKKKKHLTSTETWCKCIRSDFNDMKLMKLRNFLFWIRYTHIENILSMFKVCWVYFLPSFEIVCMKSRGRQTCIIYRVLLLKSFSTNLKQKKNKKWAISKNKHLNM